MIDRIKVEIGADEETLRKCYKEGVVVHLSDCEVCRLKVSILGPQVPISSDYGSGNLID